MKWSSISSVATVPPFGIASTDQRTFTTSLEAPESLRDILRDAHNSPAYTYPTDFTRGIIPKAIHSHNDYWRDVPFFSALSHGCTSIEADVWLYNETLYVGHDILSLTPARTFDNLYIQPILEVLDRQNPKGLVLQELSKYGVFDVDPTITLNLFVDVKTDGATTWPAIVQALQPLRQKGYLTTFDKTVKKGAVTVIGTGNTPLEQIAGVSPRDYFFDASLGLLSSTQSEITSDIAPIASGSFLALIGPIVGMELNQSQLLTLREQISVASSKGIGARYWDTPAWPVSRRNAVWAALIGEGVALLNADDIASAASLT